MLAANMKRAGLDVFLLFEKDFYLSNKKDAEFLVYNFNYEFYEDSFYLKKFELKENSLIILNSKDCLHMRIDPPFDTRYLRYLWMLRFYQEKGIKILNSADGILKYNEKLHAYSQPSSLASFVGSSSREFLQFAELMKKENYDHLILKPLDLFQGMGVEKIALSSSELEHRFHSKILENNGPIVAQPYCHEVTRGEIRAIYFKGRELGSILKVPKPGEFLANIAQGANFHAIELSPKIKMECDRIAEELTLEGVDWVAYDILGDHVSEINITCPGLLVEVSIAHQKNLALELIKQL